MPDTRLTKKILTCIQKLQTTTPWMQKVKLDMEKPNIKTRDIKAFRKKIHVWKVTPEDKTRAKLLSEGK